MISLRIVISIPEQFVDRVHRRLHHRLYLIFRDAGIAFTKNQEATLELLGEVLKWSGRYPVPNNEKAWDHYYNDVHEKHVNREREGNVGRIRANREPFPSIEVYKKLLDLANQKWSEIQLLQATG